MRWAAFALLLACSTSKPEPKPWTGPVMVLVRDASTAQNWASFDAWAATHAVTPQQQASALLVLSRGDEEGPTMVALDRFLQPSQVEGLRALYPALKAHPIVEEPPR